MENRVILLQLCQPWRHLVKNPNFREWGLLCSPQHSRGFILIYMLGAMDTRSQSPVL